MPLRKETIQQGDWSYATLDMFKGPVDHTDPVRVDVSTLTADEVDADGYLKPGVPFDKNGVLIADDGYGNIPPVHGVTVEPVKVGNDNTALSGLYDVAVGTIGQLIQAVAEENLGRAYTAAELAGFDGGSGDDAGQCQVKLV